MKLQSSPRAWTTAHEHSSAHRGRSHFWSLTAQHCSSGNIDRPSRTIFQWEVPTKSSQVAAGALAVRDSRGVRRATVDGYDEHGSDSLLAEMLTAARVMMTAIS